MQLQKSDQDVFISRQTVDASNPDKTVAENLKQTEADQPQNSHLPMAGPSKTHQNIHFNIP